MTFDPDSRSSEDITTKPEHCRAAHHWSFSDRITLTEACSTLAFFARMGNLGLIPLDFGNGQPPILRSTLCKRLLFSPFANCAKSLP
jgi:hypothetical protein